ncbi:MAG: citrate/2-methylcitrate synthase [Candidatus Competibacteraceae bacterium]
MSNTPCIELDEQSYIPPLSAEAGLNSVLEIRTRSDRTGHVTLDDGHVNTGFSKPAITYLDGDQGILRYRDIPIEQLAEQSTFVATAWLVIWGRQPTLEERQRFSALLTQHQMMHESLRNHFQGFPPNANPMAILSAMINAISCYEPEVMHVKDGTTLENAAAHVISKVRTIAAATHRMYIGQPMAYPHPEYKYCENFLHMMFSIPYRNYVPDPEMARALNLFLMLHVVDHEQTYSTRTVRTVAASGANMFASCAAGVCALWGSLHGGASMAAVIEMLEFIRGSNMSIADYIQRVKAHAAPIRLMGFGHRIYKNFDPRAQLLKTAAGKMLARMPCPDPLLDTAYELETVALQDDYFAEHKLYPNADFYSAIILRALGIPPNMFTVMRAIARMPGWIAHWKDIHDELTEV